MSVLLIKSIGLYLTGQDPELLDLELEKKEAIQHEKTISSRSDNSGGGDKSLNPKTFATSESSDDHTGNKI